MGLIRSGSTRLTAKGDQAFFLMQKIGITVFSGDKKVGIR